MCGMHRGMRRWRRGWAKEDENHDEGQAARGAWWSGHPLRSSGNRAFDDYKAETLQRLAEEQKAFHAFLERLRHARDQETFDKFMAARHGSGRNPPQPQGA